MFDFHDPLFSIIQFVENTPQFSEARVRAWLELLDQSVEDFISHFEKDLGSREKAIDLLKQALKNRFQEHWLALQRVGRQIATKDRHGR